MGVVGSCKVYGGQLHHDISAKTDLSRQSLNGARGFLAGDGEKEPQNDHNRRTNQGIDEALQAVIDIVRTGNNGVDQQQDERREGDCLQRVGARHAPRQNTSQNSNKNG